MSMREQRHRRSADAFESVVGNSRGVTDARSLARALTNSERELTLTYARLSDAAADIEQLNREKAQLAEVVTCLEGDVALADHLLDCSRRDRDLARAALMRAGRRDPVVNSVAEHHGNWTPGRPYLTNQHVYLPNTSVCFRARAGGALVGASPGKSSRWRRCGDGACPQPTAVPVGSHPVRSGYALRQEVWWWDKDLKRWALEDLSSEYLMAVIDFLRDAAPRLHGTEFDSARFHVPCPVWAYASARSWLSDTPLMRALLAERRRRRLRPRRAS